MIRRPALASPHARRKVADAFGFAEGQATGSRQRMHGLRARRSKPLAPSEAPRFSVPYRAGRRCFSLKIRPRCPRFYSWRWAAHCKVAAHPGVGGPQLTNSTPVGDPLRGRRMLAPVRPRVAHDAVTLPNLRGRQSKWCLPSGARGRAWRGSAQCRSPRRRPSPSSLSDLTVYLGHGVSLRS
jgi:hypothetical protein